MDPGRLRWSLQAAEDFENIIARIQEESDAERARKVGRELYDDLSYIVEWPRSGLALEKPKGCRQRIFRKTYRVLYTVLPGDVVELVGIYHVRENKPGPT